MAWLPRLLVVLVMLLLGPHVGKFAVLSLPPRTTSVLPLMPVQHATTDAAARPAGRRSMSPEALPPMTAWRLWSIETVPGAADGSGGASRERLGPVARGRWRVLTARGRCAATRGGGGRQVEDDAAHRGDDVGPQFEHGTGAREGNTRTRPRKYQTTKRCKDGLGASKCSGRGAANSCRFVTALS